MGLGFEAECLTEHLSFSRPGLFLLEFLSHCSHASNTTCHESFSYLELTLCHQHVSIDRLHCTPSVGLNVSATVDST